MAVHLDDSWKAHARRLRNNGKTWDWISNELTQTSDGACVAILRLAPQLAHCIDLRARFQYAVVSPIYGRGRLPLRSRNSVRLLLGSSSSGHVINAELLAQYVVGSEKRAAALRLRYRRSSMYCTSGRLANVWRFRFSVQLGRDRDDAADEEREVEELTQYMLEELAKPDAEQPSRPQQPKPSAVIHMTLHDLRRAK